MDQIILFPVDYVHINESHYTYPEVLIFFNKINLVKSFNPFDKISKKYIVQSICKYLKSINDEDSFGKI